MILVVYFAACGELKQLVYALLIFFVRGLVALKDNEHY